MSARRRRQRQIGVGWVPIYGVTTGFGDSSHRQIDARKGFRFAGNARRNDGLRDRTVGVDEESRATMLIRANCFARGYSAIRPAVVDRLLDFINLGITPAIREQGSVGASGDLVPLSYVAAALQGRRRVFYQGQLQPAAEVLARLNLAPITLK